MSTEAGQLAGKTALVTGGSTGIGFASAERLAEEGAHVFVTGRREAALDEAVAAIGRARATAVVGDVSRAADVDRLYAAVRARGRGSTSSSRTRARGRSRRWRRRPGNTSTRSSAPTCAAPCSPCGARSRSSTTGPR